MYPKPKKKKHRNKYRHISNKRITEYTECEVCHKNPATETHEIYRGNYYRNMSVKYGAQIKVCRKCHDEIDQGKHDYLMVEWRKKLMRENGWNLEQWREIFGKKGL